MFFHVSKNEDLISVARLQAYFIICYGSPWATLSSKLYNGWICVVYLLVLILTNILFVNDIINHFSKKGLIIFFLVKRTCSVTIFVFVCLFKKKAMHFNLINHPKHSEFTLYSPFWKLSAKIESKIKLHKYYNCIDIFKSFLPKKSAVNL